MIIFVHRKSLLIYPDPVKLNHFYLLLQGEISGLKLLSQANSRRCLGSLAQIPWTNLKSTEKLAEKQAFSNYPRNLVILFCFYVHLKNHGGHLTKGPLNRSLQHWSFRGRERLRALHRDQADAFFQTILFLTSSVVLSIPTRLELWCHKSSWFGWVTEIPTLMWHYDHRAKPWI